MENDCFRDLSSSCGTLDLPNLPNPFATETGQNLIDLNSHNNTFKVNDAPPKVFFPPKMSLTKELEYKKKRPILEHISTSISSPHKLVLKPTTSHPLNHQITTSPITPTFYKKFHRNDELLSDGIGKRSCSSKINMKGIEIVQNINNNKLRKRRSMPDISVNTNLKNDLLKDDDNEKKMVIVHEIKPSDTIAGVALFYGIEISTLKKANKLWANDSIHLRKFLYIPIDQCSIINDEAKVVVQDDHISIKANRSFSDNIRPSFSITSTASPSTPFTIYERELLFCTLPEHANYVHSNHDHNLHSRHTSASTSSTWSITSSSSSTSSTTSNNNNANNFTRAEIQQLSADKLTFFPSKRMTNSLQTPNAPLVTPTLPSPSPVSHLNRHKQHRNISLPLPAMKQDSTQKTGTDRRTRSVLNDSYNAELLSSLNKVFNKKDLHIVSPTLIRSVKHV